MTQRDLAGGQIRGRYDVFDEIAAGGMGAVCLGRLVGPVGFARTVAVKRLHAHLARDPEFVSLFLDEARLAARIRHPNVVPTLDVMIQDGTVLIVMEYVHGQSLSALARAAVASQDGRTPMSIAASITCAALYGLHAAHEARDERGDALMIVHRDVSPQNVLVGVDGIARMLDFGIAKATLRSESTRDGHLKGKLRYMSPEQASGAPVDRRSDVFSAGVVLWELLAGEPLFAGDNPLAIARDIHLKSIPPPSAFGSNVPTALDAVVARALARAPEERFETARAMAIAIEEAIVPVTAREIGEWVERIAGPTLAERAAAIAAIERRSPSSATPRSSPSAAVGESSRVPPSEKTLGATTAVTQVPSADVAAPVRSTQATWGRARGILLAVAAGAAISGAAILGGRAREAPPASSSAPPAPVAVTVDERPPAPSASSAEAPPVASTPPPPAGTRVGPHRSAKPVRRPSAAGAKTSAPSPSCVPPYVVEASGVKRYKAECVD